MLLALLGIAFAVVSALADVLDIGEQGFGWKQTLGVVVGAAAAVVGTGLALTGGSSGSSLDRL